MKVLSISQGSQTWLNISQEEIPLIAAYVMSLNDVTH